MTVLETRAVHVLAGALARPVVRGAGFSLAPGEIVGLVGESGSGKTLLARTALELCVVDPGPVGGVLAMRTPEGAVFEAPCRPASAGRALAGLRPGFASAVFQHPHEALDPLRTMGEQIAETIRIAGAGQGSPDAVGAALAEVALPASAARFYPHQLSGGMAQRAALALALASQPEVLIADEPVTALDWSVRREVLDRLIALAASRALAVLLITHDLDVVRYAAHRVVVMFGGCIVEEIETAALFADSEPLHPYTASLLDALHALRRRESRPSAVLAEPSREGCPYAPRCALRSRRELGARCAADVPWTELSPNHRLRCVGLLP